jgi:hypothetical protein
MAAVEVVISRDSVADPEAANAGADRDDLAGNLVPDNARKFGGYAPGLDVLNRQPRSARDDPRDGFARARDGIGELRQLEWRVRTSENHCFHLNRPLPPMRISRET